MLGRKRSVAFLPPHPRGRASFASAPLMNETPPAGTPPLSPLEERLARIREQFNTRRSPGEVARAEPAPSAPPVDRPAPLAETPSRLETVAKTPELSAQPAPLESSPLQPVTALRRLATLFDPGRPLPEAGSADGVAPGPQGLAEIAERLGLAMELTQKRPSMLTAADCPCVLLLRDGLAWVVTTANDKDRLVLEGDRGKITLPRRLIEVNASGAIFRVRPAPLRQPVTDEPQTVSKPATSLHSFVLQSLSGHKRYLAALVIAGAFSSLAMLALPVMTMAVFDRVIPHMSFATLWALAIGIGLLLILDLGMRQARMKLSEGVSVAASQSLSARLFQRLLTAPLAVLPRQASSISQPFAELTQSAALAAQFTAGLLVDIPFFLVVVAYLMVIGGPIGLLPVIAAVITFALHIVTHRKTMRLAAEDSHLGQMQQQMMIDGVAAIETIKASNASDRLLAQWERRNDEAAWSSHPSGCCMALQVMSARYFRRS